MLAVTGSFSGTGQSQPINPSSSDVSNQSDLYYLNVWIWGTFSATIQLVRSFDNGVTWHAASKDIDGTAIEFTAPVSIPIRESESNILYALECTSYSSGQVNYRLSA